MRLFLLFFLFCSIIQINAQPQHAVEGNPRMVSRPIFVIPWDSIRGRISEIPQHIMGRGDIGAELLASFLLDENNNADRAFTEALAALYIAEAEAEGVNHVVAFAQMCLETGFLRYGGLVIPEMNNFCGLGAIGPGITGEWFPTAELGVRAHVQHLQAYATSEPLRGELMDPRYRFVRRGSSPSIQGLAGSWAADPLYAEKIEGILQRLYFFYRINTPLKR